MIIFPENLSKKTKKETINRVFEFSAPSLDFYLMLILSGIIVSLGLIFNNIPVVIGGMLIAPMLFPILSLAMGIVVGYPKLMKRGAIVVFNSIIIVSVIALIISLIVIDKNINGEILSRTTPNLGYFIIALVSGGAVAYSFARPNLSEVLPGVAITVSLVPPLAAIGISISILNASMIIGALSLFFLNLLGIIFAAIFVFATMNFYEAKEEIVKKIKAEEKIIEKAAKEKEEEVTQDTLEELQKNLKEATKLLKDKETKKTEPNTKKKKAKK